MFAFCWELFEQGDKAGLDKMFVGGESSCDIFFLHHDKADAIGNLPSFIVKNFVLFLAKYDVRTRH